ncbi:DUF3369 domain-containing protein [Shewanella sp. 202IG2-18]|uniref:DUF3369 domain-containing protein n=1 Tax=Parashewanella hymeniacidonis TaxID=2807618 RepID=UPI00195F8030|nr:HD domain-containing phosphohydrolase [Parashewanella hymeniacidonis]MBM7072779.1 DUF3369 domain-containing protein [Parashewanella hymeniacidonis]
MDWLEDDRELSLDSELKEERDVWHVLIVDDDKDVHTSTKLIMSGFEFENKAIKFQSAYSGKEARELLAQGQQFGLILLDVVMEADDAGLELAKFIRKQLNNNYSRIILRTGQPGIAPEQSVIRNFDIDGYKAKTDFRRNDLETTFYTSLRAYRDICLLQQHRKVLKQVISSITNVSEFSDLQKFAEAVLEQLRLVLNITNTKMFINVEEGFGISKIDRNLKIFSGKGSKVEIITRNDIDELHSRDKQLFTQALTNKQSFQEDNYYVYYHKSENEHDTVFAFLASEVIDYQGIEMIDLYLKNVMLSYENLLLSNSLKETQELTISLMGGAMESRSKETGAHVVRVGLYAKTLAELSGKSTAYCEAIRLAAQLHDVGKVGIPDKILNKPEKLDSEEWNVMKTHSQKGWEILSGNQNSTFQMAANLALDHHERWDGAGYPNGKANSDISLEGRITSLADVFDALCSKRCYKDSWSILDAKAEIMRCSGTQFDPNLVEVFDTHFEQFAGILKTHPDHMG